MQFKKQLLEMDMEEQIGFNLGHTSRLYVVPCLINLHAEYVMWNARLDAVQAGIKIAGSNINNLRYADDTTLMAESKELGPLDESEREEWKSWLKSQHSES